jgi:glycosyltransferase involved in cell wall biosynthesis
MITVDVIGDADSATAFAHINRHWCAGLRQRGCSVNAADALVRLHHDFAAEFLSLDLAPGTSRLAVRPWDFGPYPRVWAERLETHWEGLIVHSEWTRSLAVRGGVSPERVHVVPLGFDDAIFQPAGVDVASRPFRFLFVGASIHRKGLDILRRAWQSAFGPGEAVCLVLKDHTADRFYRGIQQRESWQQAARDPAVARIEYVDDYLDATALAALYRSCHVGVFPYRAEGFALPVLEAMACGLPCIVPRFGPCLDYCTDDNAFFVPARRMSLPVSRDYAINTLGFRLPVEEVDFCEVRVSDLAATMRAVYEGGATAARRRGLQAAQDAHAGWTWQHSVGSLIGCLTEVTKGRHRGCMAKPS